MWGVGNEFSGVTSPDVLGPASEDESVSFEVVSPGPSEGKMEEEHQVTEGQADFQLPDHLWIDIFSRAGPETIANGESVCWGWHNALHGQENLKTVCIARGWGLPEEGAEVDWRSRFLWASALESGSFQRLQTIEGVPHSRVGTASRMHWVAGEWWGRDTLQDTIHVWDLLRGEESRSLRQNHTQTLGYDPCAGPGPDDMRYLVLQGEVLVSGCVDGQIVIWDWKSGTVRGKVEGPFSLSGLAVWDDVVFCSGRMGDPIRGVDWKTGEEVCRFEGVSRDSVTALGVNRDCLVAGMCRGGIRAWNWRTGEQKELPGGHGNSLVEVIPAGDFVISRGYDRVLRVWDLDKGKLVQSLVADSPSDQDWRSTSVNCMAVSGDFVFAGMTDRIKVWNWRTGEQLKDLETGGGQVVSLRAEGYRLYSRHRDGTVGIWGVVRQTTRAD